ncbi:MAG: SusC/RagA family TonB-linked outer membrane protein [Ginsengibacter sp.]
MEQKPSLLLKYLLLIVICTFTSYTVLAQQPTVVTGVVNTKDAAPIPNVSVTALNVTTKKSYSTMSDSKGKFRFDKIDPVGTYTFTFTSVGYKAHTISGYKIKAGENTNLLATLTEDVSYLNEVVVTGFQTITKSKFSGAAVTLKAKDVIVEGQVDVSRMLQGKAAGVSVQNVSGTFGSAPKIRVRGATSLSGDNKPLWVVDGIVLEDIVPISNDQLSSGDPTTLLGSSVAGLNANDIESFDILKDAAATALYGGRAMNGVIVITTKKGKVGAPRVTYTTNLTTSLKPSYNNYNIMNSADQMTAYAELESKGFLNLADIANRNDWGVYGKMYNLINTYDPVTKTFGLANTPEAKNAFLQKYALANTDWFDLLFKNQLIQEHNIAVSSGTEKSQNYLSVSYYGDNGWTIADKVDRLTFNFNNSFNFNKKLSTGISVRGSYRGQKAPGANSRKSNTVNGQFDRDFDINPFSYSLNTSRALTAYDDKGNLEFFQRNYAPFNIMYELENNYLKLNLLDIQLQGEVKYKFNKNFDYGFLGAVRMVSTNTESIVDETANAAMAYRAMKNTTVANSNIYLYGDPDNPNGQPISVLPQGGFYNKAETMLKTFNFRNIFSYHQSLGRSDVAALLGQEVRSYDRQNFTSVGPGYQYGKGGIPFIDYRYYKKNIEQNNFPYSMQPTFDRAASFFANASYTYNKKYNIDGSFRYDGGNRLGQSTTARWLPTATVAASWNVDQENFLKSVDVINYLKIRASYGLTGSLGNATNSAAVYRSGTSIRPYLDEKETEIYVADLENAELTWEKKNTFNVGADMGIFQNKLRLTFDYYYNTSYDLIDPVKTSGIGGQYTKQANNADLTGRGIEMSVNATPYVNKDWEWNIGANFGTNHTRITKTAALPDIYTLIQASGGNYLGYPVYSLFAIDFQKLMAFAGTPVFKDETGQVSNNVYFQASKFTNNKGEEVPIDSILKYQGPVTPTLTGGFTNTIKFRNLSLNFFISFQTGNKILLTPTLKNAYTDLDAFPKEFNNRFAQPGDAMNTTFPVIMDKLVASRDGGSNLYNSYNYSTERVVNGDFVRLQTVSLRYAFSNKIVDRLKLSSLSVMGAANNLWLIASDKRLFGQDPEFFNSGGVAQPVSKQFTFTLQVGF